MKAICLLSGLIVIGFTASAYGQSFTSEKARDALTVYKKSMRDLNQKYHAYVKKAGGNYQKKATAIRDQLLADLEAAKVEQAQAVNLREANKIDQAITMYKKVSTTPPEQVVVETDSKALAKLKAENRKLKRELAAAKKPATIKPQIPKEAVEWNGHHYLRVDVRYPETVAKALAEKMGGHLARLESVQEQLFIARFIRAGSQKWYRVDGSDDLQEGVWLFSDGSPLGSLQWAPGQPNSASGGQNSLIIQRSDGKVNDMGRDELAGSVIEWD